MREARARIKHKDIGMSDTHGHKLGNGEIATGLEIVSGTYSEALKGSNLSNAGAMNCLFVGGDEDCVDFVRGSRYVLEGCELEAGPLTRTFVTAKGGIRGLKIANTRLKGNTKWWGDIRLGDHTIYNKGKLMGMDSVVLDNVSRADGKPVRVLVMDCSRPRCRNGKYKVFKMWKPLVWLFMKLKG